MPPCPLPAAPPPPPASVGESATPADTAVVLPACIDAFPAPVAQSVAFAASLGFKRSASWGCIRKAPKCTNKYHSEIREGWIRKTSWCKQRHDGC
jgi:hypothetical protein